MGSVIQYIRINCKRMVSHGLYAVLALLVTGILLVGLLFVLSKAMEKSSVLEPIQVGMIIPEGEATTRMAARLIGGMESVQSVAELKEVSKEDGEEALAKGELEALIRFPENFYEAINNGTNTPVEVVLRNDSLLASKAFRELVLDGLSYIRTSEASIYAVEEQVLAETAEGKVLSCDVYTADAIMTELYTQQVLKRNKIFTQEEYSAFEGVEISTYYLVAGILLLLYFQGMAFGFYYDKQSLKTEKVLRIAGIHPMLPAIMKTLCMACSLFVMALLLCGLLGKVDSNLTLKLALGLWPVLFALAGIFHLLYSLVGESFWGGMVILLLGILGILTSGVIYPVCFLPEWMQKLAGVQLFYIWHRYALQVLQESAGSPLPSLMIGLLGMLGGGVYTWKKA